MPPEPDTSIVARPAQQLAALRPLSELDCLPSEFESSIVIRPSQHIIPQPYGLLRTDLLHRLAQASAHPVTLLIGGSGAGKTNLLARFCHEQSESIPLWYTLDDDDFDPHTVLARLYWALAEAVPALRERLSRDALGQREVCGDWSAMLAHWIGALHDSPRPLLLCIDGRAEIDPRLAPLFSQLLRRLHTHLRIVFVCQRRPPDAFWADCDRLRGHKRLATLADPALRFSADETRELCALYGYAASEQEARALRARARGRAHLIDYALRTSTGRPLAEVIAQIPPGGAADLDAWLQADLEQRFVPAEIERLVGSAVPCRLIAARAAAACGLPADPLPLERWRATIPALQEIEPGAYRYHSLFRAFLLRRFAALPEDRRMAAVRAAAAAALAAGDWPAAAAKLAAYGDWGALNGMIEARAAKCVLDHTIDAALSEMIIRAGAAARCDDTPWALCYQAMEQRVCRGDYIGACRLGQAATEQFARHGDAGGHARACAETAIARYHLGQYMIALTELSSCPMPDQPACAAALLLAIHLNQSGVGALAEAVEAARRGLQDLEREPDPARRVIWRAALLRGLAAAQHHQGELAAARRALEEAVALARPCYANSYAYYRSIYEQGVLEQRAGRLDLALALLQRARERAEQSPCREPLWRWIVVAEGHALRDKGQLDEAGERYQSGGWGEGGEGPLMLWLLQGRRDEARLAVEARLAAAYASASPFEATNLAVFLALLELEAGATQEVRAALEAAAEHYATHGFRHHLASVQLHLAALAYEIGRSDEGDRILAEALEFGAAQGYFNYVWWLPERMRRLLTHAVKSGIMPEYSAELLRVRRLAAPPEHAAAPAAHVAAPGEPAALRLRCLGGFEVWVDGRPLPKKRWQGHRAGAIRMQRLLLFLARQRDPQAIETIVRYVWPDIWNRIDASTNFHLTLAGLRRVFEPELDQGSASRFVLTTQQGYQLLPGLDVRVDLDQFLEHMRDAQLAESSGDVCAVRAAFIQAEQLYGGGFALAKPDPGEAEEYHRAALEALRWLASDDLRRDASDSCIARARRLLREDQWDATASALLIAAYLQRGNRRAARQHYERFIQLHGQPSPELVHIARSHWL